MIYTITIDDAEEWAITAAREANNADRQPMITNPDTGEEIPNPLIFADNATYMQFVMVRAVDSWRVHYPDANPATQQGTCTGH